MKSICKLLLLFTLIITFNVSKSFSQNSDKVILTINNDKIMLEEFERVFKKNNSKNDYVDKKALDEYMDLFINFKLKVKDAENNKVDTANSFIKELEGYRKQLSQPYLTDKNVNENLLKEAYNRMNWDVRASHILIKLSQNPTAKDTLTAFNKIVELRNKIIKGEPFDKIAKEFSEDPSAKDHPAQDERPAYKGNAGDLGYFTVFQMIYPFESMAYATKVGEISQPIRTQFGYHIIKVTDKRQAQGQIQVAHIMIKAPDGMSKDDSIVAKKKIEDIYSNLLSGADFQELAKKYSEDYTTANKGGILPWFGTGRMVPEFEKVAFALSNDGDISQPIKTSYGWHIIKRISRKNIPSYDEIKNELKAKIAKDSRSNLPQEAFIEKLKANYKYTQDEKAIKDFYKVIDDSIFSGKWEVKRASKLQKNMATFYNVNINQQEFAKYIAKNQVFPKQEIKALVDKMFKQYIDQRIVEYEASILENKYPEFKALMKEYKEGMMLFEITDRNVWTKAVKDTIGLQEFYAKNKDKYMWPERIEGIVFTCSNKKIADNLRNLIDDGIEPMDAVDSINESDPSNVYSEEGKFTKDEKDIFQKIEWKIGLSQDLLIDNQENIVFVLINKILKPETKQLNESKGLITSEYQNYLEKEWIDSLRKQSNISINNDVLYLLINNK
ncbi:MAG: hypothetical protein A2X12_01090 [Bacteroidetes bacterium GWE2_29_8]|nr:MAG: hypothetical protein A2X12_01090 [Bacteroidetes bacterium GWE2_29_8]OFY14408.1 MAG: hypothetical protein A2X02_01225 [Bacteroidetes bacterium GWF2_29_10]